MAETQKDNSGLEIKDVQLSGVAGASGGNTDLPDGYKPKNPEYCCSWHKPLPGFEYDKPMCKNCCFIDTDGKILYCTIGN